MNNSLDRALQELADLSPEIAIIEKAAFWRGFFWGVTSTIGIAFLLVLTGYLFASGILLS